MSKKMKDSGIEWIGEIPESWKIKPNKWVMKKKKEICDKYCGEDILSLTMNGVVVRDLENPTGKMPLTFDGYQYVSAGNLLMCLFDIDVTPRCIGVINSDGLTSPAYSQFELIEGNERYYYYYYLNLDYTKELLHMAKNLRHSLTESQLGEIYVPVPSNEEQLCIANYLDTRCSLLDQTIEKQKQVIGKLREYKQAVITEAVTKGLEHNVQMKDSGIEWIQEIPEQWEICKFKKTFSMKKGLPITKDNLVESGISVISYGQIHSKLNIGTEISDDLIRFVNKSYIETNSESLTYYGDFLFADTSEDLEGAGNYVFMNGDDKLFAGYHTIIARPHSVANPKYLAYLFKTDCWRSQIRSRVSGIKLYSITQKILKSITLILPSDKEQESIVEYLDSVIRKVDFCIKNKEITIEKLELYKKSLIHECVTGKREVK